MDTAAPSPTPRPALLDALRQDANQCVACGLCLPHCPTYQVHGHEAESPRGRIMLMKAWLEQDLPLSAGLQQHLDQCLLCRSCEHVCPNHVPYGQLLDGVRAAQAEQPPLAHNQLSPMQSRMLRWISRHPGRLSQVWRWGQPAWRAWQRLKLTPNWPLPAAMMQRWGTPPTAPTTTAGQPHAQLFLGCVARVADHATLHAAVRLLQALNVNVHIPRTQGCCGALALHAGDAATASAQSTNNQTAFLPEHGPVLVTATGCASTLLEQNNLAQAGLLVQDIWHFLAARGPLALQLRPAAAAVAVHVPCSQRFPVRSDQAMRQVLAQVPQAQFLKLPPGPNCCGAAGDHHLRHPETAQALAGAWLAGLDGMGPITVLSANVGCLLWLEQEALRRNISLQFQHPLHWLAEYLLP